MSDAMTEIAADQSREERFADFLEDLIDYLRSPTEEGRQKVLAAAEATDSIGRGYFGGRTDLASGLDEAITNLEASDKAAWARILWLTHGQDVYVWRSHGGEAHHVRQFFAELKEMSPFKGQLIAFADYGIGFVRLSGEWEDFVAKVINHHDLKTSDGDKYFVVLDGVKPETSEVVWLGSNYPKQDEPRPASAKNIHKPSYY